MRRAALSVCGALVLIGPTVLAFLTGAYFEGPRVWAGVLAWACVLAAVALGGRLPRGRGPLLALGGLALLAAWSLASIAWAPVAGDIVPGAAGTGTGAYQASQIVVLYAGALLAAVLVMGEPRVRTAAEPVLALGAAVVIGYGLAGRLLPGVLHYARSVSALGRLEQPLTYWNAMGELAAIGLVLCARLAGDRARPAAVRMLAAAAAAPLGLGVYTSFSRGALFAGVAGLIALIAIVPRREQLAGVLICVGAGVLSAAAAAPLHGVTSLDGTLAHREHQGAIVLAVLCVVAALAAATQATAITRVRERPLRMPAHRGLIATVLICAGLALAIVVGANETDGASTALSGGASRLVSLRSNRYDYWGVALRAFSHEPLRGVGAGNWQLYWLRWRPIEEFAVDAHSLPLQTLAELGIVGALALAAFLLGVLESARRALRRSALTAGPAAAFVAYVAHAPLDWDWEMPALTLVAIVLAGLIVAVAATDADAEPADTAEPAQPTEPLALTPA